jgi:hypothetical protein
MNGAPRRRAFLLAATAVAIVFVIFFAAWRAVERLGMSGQ